MYYWINIDTNLKRKDFMVKQLKNKENTRISAIIPSTLPDIIYYKKGKDNYKPAEYACICSHIKAIETALTSNKEYFIILEDDMIFSFDINIEKMLKTAPKDWEVLQLMTSNSRKLDKLYNLSLEDTHWIKWENGNFCTGSYVMNKTGAKKLLKRLKPNGILDFSTILEVPLQADYIIYYFCTTYTSTFPLFYSNNQLVSQIHTNHENDKISMDKIKKIQQQSKIPFYSTFLEGSSEIKLPK